MPLKDSLRNYTKQILLNEIGIEGQLKISKSKVAIVGMGGLGCPLSLYLCAAGIGELLLIDEDVIARDNLARQILFSQPDLGQSKVEVAKAKLEVQNPNCKIVSSHIKLTTENARKLLADCDIIADCSDQLSVRYLINRIAYELVKPWVFASVSGYSGQICGFDPGFSPCFECLFPPDNSAVAIGNCNQLGVLGPGAGAIGSFQGLKVLELITQCSPQQSGKFSMVDLRNLESKTISFQANSSCAICTTQATKPTSPTPRHPDLKAKDLTPHEKEAEKMFLLDLRETEEILESPKPSDLQIPFVELPFCLEKLPTNSPILCFCKSGKRSRLAARYLRSQGFEITALDQS